MKRNKLKNIIFSVFILSVSLILIPVVSFAVCPVCTVAVAGGVGLSRWLGVDDVISGLWIGGFLLSAVLWCLNWLKDKNINFPLKKIIVFAGFYLLTLLPLYFTKIIGYSCNKLWGQDKLLLGIIFGSLGFGFGVNLDHLLRKRNNGKAYFSFQKVILPISILVVLSIIFYFVTRC